MKNPKLGSIMPQGIHKKRITHHNQYFLEAAKILLTDEGFDQIEDLASELENKNRHVALRQN